MIEIRNTLATDTEALKTVLNSIDLFPAEMLDDMISDYLGNPESEDIWLTAVENDQPMGLAYCVPEKLTNGTFNLLAIGVRSDLQGKGIGRKFMAHLEALLTQKGKRIIIVDTSGSDDFALTRKFYEQLGYAKEATIRDFWDDGEDKVTYYKRLQ